jgi:hypothetical protein
MIHYHMNPFYFVLQSNRGKAATEQAARLSHFIPLEKPRWLSPIGGWAFISPSLFERLSLFFIFSCLVPARPG